MIVKIGLGISFWSASRGTFVIWRLALVLVFEVLEEKQCFETWMGIAIWRLRLQNTTTMFIRFALYNIGCLKFMELSKLLLLWLQFPVAFPRGKVLLLVTTNNPICVLLTMEFDRSMHDEWIYFGFGLWWIPGGIAFYFRSPLQCLLHISGWVIFAWFCGFVSMSSNGFQRMHKLKLCLILLCIFLNIG